jgi:hypothetical protein
MAFSLSLCAAMRARNASVTSAEEISRSRIRQASSAAVAKHTSEDEVTDVVMSTSGKTMNLLIPIPRQVSDVQPAHVPLRCTGPQMDSPRE